jgi:hypothetical protein
MVVPVCHWGGWTGAGSYRPSLPLQEEQTLNIDLSVDHPASSVRPTILAFDNANVFARSFKALHKGGVWGRGGNSRFLYPCNRWKWSASCSDHFTPGTYQIGYWPVLGATVKIKILMSPPELEVRLSYQWAVILPSELLFARYRRRFCELQSFSRVKQNERKIK